MNKLFVAMTLVVFLAVTLGLPASANSGSRGPAPNAGDCVPDGSGFESPNGPNNAGSSGTGNGPAGPAPNSGDGVPDGSGFDSPAGPNGSGPAGSGNGNLSGGGHNRP